MTSSFLTSMKAMLIESIAQKWCSIRPIFVNSASNSPSGWLITALPNRHTISEKFCRYSVSNLNVWGAYYEGALTAVMYRLLASSLSWSSILPYCIDALSTSSNIFWNTSIGKRDRNVSKWRMSLPFISGSSQQYGAMSRYWTLLNDTGNFSTANHRWC